MTTSTAATVPTIRVVPTSRYCTDGGFAGAEGGPGSGLSVRLPFDPDGGVFCNYQIGLLEIDVRASSLIFSAVADGARRSRPSVRRRRTSGHIEGRLERPDTVRGSIAGTGRIEILTLSPATE
jgi:hypothetical protein